jgi:hypothetical protein
VAAMNYFVLTVELRLLKTLGLGGNSDEKKIKLAFGQDHTILLILVVSPISLEVSVD